MEDTIFYPSSTDHDAIGRFLELQSAHQSHTSLFKAMRLSPCSGVSDYGAAVRLDIGTPSNTGGAVAKNTIALQVKDRFGNNVAKVFEIDIETESCDEYAGNLSLPIYYALAETGAGSQGDTTFANGSPAGKKGKPRITIFTDANGAATLTASRVRADGSTAAVTNGGNLADLRLHFKLKCQPEALTANQGARCTAFT